MSTNKKRDNQNSGVSINNGGRIIIKGDVVGRDKIISTVQEIKQMDFIEAMHLWETRMVEEVDKEDLSKDEKNDIKKQVNAIKTVALEGKGEDTGRLEKLINTLLVMSPDIFDVAVTTLTSPLAGVGLVVKKIGDRARLEVATVQA